MQQIIKFSDVDEVIQRANNTTYGLAAAVFTKDIDKATTISHSLQAGTVWLVNHNNNAAIVQFKNSNYSDS